MERSKAEHLAQVIEHLVDKVLSAKGPGATGHVAKTEALKAARERLVNALELDA